MKENIKDLTFIEKVDKGFVIFIENKPIDLTKYECLNLPADLKDKTWALKLVWQGQSVDKFEEGLLKLIHGDKTL